MLVLASQGSVDSILSPVAAALPGPRLAWGWFNDEDLMNSPFAEAVTYVGEFFMSPRMQNRQFGGSFTSLSAHACAREHSPMLRLLSPQ